VRITRNAVISAISHGALKLPLLHVIVVVRVGYGVCQRSGNIARDAALAAGGQPNPSPVRRSGCRARSATVPKLSEPTPIVPVRPPMPGAKPVTPISRARLTLTSTIIAWDKDLGREEYRADRSLGAGFDNPAVAALTNQRIGGWVSVTLTGFSKSHPRLLPVLAVSYCRWCWKSWSFELREPPFMPKPPPPP